MYRLERLKLGRLGVRTFCWANEGRCGFCLLFLSYQEQRKSFHHLFYFSGRFIRVPLTPLRGVNSYTLMERTVRFIIKRLLLMFQRGFARSADRKQAASKLRRESVKMMSKGCRYGAWSSPRNIRRASLSLDTPLHPPRCAYLSQN